MKNIKKFYTENFSSDESGLEINENATFQGLFQVLDNYDDVYEYIGICDSLIRERIFWELSKVMEVHYQIVYDQWMKAS
jgi:hypothetical protein